MAIFFKHFLSSLASPPLHHLVFEKPSPPPFPYFTFLNLKLSFFSTSIAADSDTPNSNNHPEAENAHTQQQNPITQFLLNECGLSQSQLSAVIRKRVSLLKRRSTETPRQAVQFFRDSGFTEEQVRSIIVRTPTVLCLKVDRQLKPQLELLKSLGLTGKYLVGLCKKFKSLGSSQENMRRKVQYFENLFASKASLTMALKRQPSLLTADVERSVNPNLDLLQQSEIPGELLSFLISRCPANLCSNANTLKVRIEYVKNMGISPSSKAFVYALFVLVCHSPETYEKKLKHLESMGLLDHEIKEVLKKNPTLLNTSIDKMQKIMGFLIHTAGLPANIIVTYPALFNYSLETRIKPRYSVFKLVSELPLYKPIPSLPALIQLGEHRFLERFVKASPYSTRLLDIYRGKDVDLDIIQTPFRQD